MTASDEVLPGRIAHWSMGAPSTWGTWSPRRGAEAADAVAADLADAPDARAHVRQAVLAVDQGLPPEGEAALFTAGVWVPDRTSGEVCGSLVAELLVGVPAGPDPVGAMLAGWGRPTRREDKRRGVRTLEAGVARTEVPAGPMLVETRTWADATSKLVTSTIVCTVVPPGSTEAFSVEFATTIPSMREALVDEAGVIFGHVELEVV